MRTSPPSAPPHPARRALGKGRHLRRTRRPVCDPPDGTLTGHVAAAAERGGLTDTAPSARAASTADSVGTPPRCTSPAPRPAGTDAADRRNRPSDGPWARPIGGPHATAAPTPASARNSPPGTPPSRTSTQAVTVLRSNRPRVPRPRRGPGGDEGESGSRVLDPEHQRRAIDGVPQRRRRRLPPATPSLENLVLLCGRHPRALHAGRLEAPPPRTTPADAHPAPPLGRLADPGPWARNDHPGCSPRRGNSPAPWSDDPPECSAA